MGFPRARARVTLAKGGERKLKRGGAGEPRCFWSFKKDLASAVSRRFAAAQPSGSSGTGPKSRHHRPLRGTGSTTYGCCRESEFPHVGGAVGHGATDPESASKPSHATQINPLVANLRVP